MTVLDLMPQCVRKVSVHLQGVGSDVHERLYRPEPELNNWTLYRYCTSRVTSILTTKSTYHSLSEHWLSRHTVEGVGWYLFTPGKETRCPLYRSWGGPWGAFLDGSEKLCPHQVQTPYLSSCRKFLYWPSYAGHPYWLVASFNETHKRNIVLREVLLVMSFC
jgi:hypothetical protein